MSISMTGDVESFAAVAGPFLSAQLEREQLERIVDRALHGRHPQHPNPFATALGDDGGHFAVAIRTPPHNVLWTRLPGSPASIAVELIDFWRARDPDVVGVG